MRKNDWTKLRTHHHAYYWSKWNVEKAWHNRLPEIDHLQTLKNGMHNIVRLLLKALFLLLCYDPSTWCDDYEAS